MFSVDNLIIMDSLATLASVYDFPLPPRPSPPTTPKKPRPGVPPFNLCSSCVLNLYCLDHPPKSPKQSPKPVPNDQSDRSPSMFEYDFPVIKKQETTISFKGEQ